jgi:hypothetical protein
VFVYQRTLLLLYQCCKVVLAKDDASYVWQQQQWVQWHTKAGLGKASTPCSKKSSTALLT